MCSFLVVTNDRQNTLDKVNQLKTIKHIVEHIQSPTNRRKWASQFSFKKEDYFKEHV